MDQQLPAHRGERGASATEYALLISGIAVMLVAMIVMFGESLAASLAGFANVL